MASELSLLKFILNVPSHHFLQLSGNTLNLLNDIISHLPHKPKTQMKLMKLWGGIRHLPDIRPLSIIN